MTTLFDTESVETSTADQWPPPPATPPASTPPPPAAAPKRRWPALGMAAILAASVVGGTAGFATAHYSTSTSAAAPATALLSTTGMSVTAIVAKLEPSVVSIQTTVVQSSGRATVTAQGAGTGLILTSNGEILTNAHVVDGATSITVTLPGETTARRATLVGADTADDIAVLQVDSVSGLTPATIGDPGALQVGDDVVAIGNALALDGGMTVTKGIVSALGRSIQTDTAELSGLIQTDAAISSGDSGGPLVDAQGQVVGIDSAGAVSSSNVSAENIGFAIPIDTALKIAAQLEASAS